jgi:phage terminase large subunit-like protein
MAETNWIFAYYQGIKDGTYTVGRWIRLLYEYIIKGLERKDFFFDQKKANAAIDWMEKHCFHTEGPLAPRSISLEVWQKAFYSAIYGLVDKNGLRQFREILLVIGRKNGKTKMASSAAKYTWHQDGGFGARVFCIAPKLEQADLVYNDVWTMTQLDPEWQALREEVKQTDGRGRLTQDDSMLARHRQTDLSIPGTNSTVKKIAFSSQKSDGFNPSLCICDEVAAWPGDQGLKQYEVMKSGMGARPEGQLLSCTTSGYINDGIYDELVKRSTRFLMGESKEQKLLPFLYIVDDIEKWNDINELRKANPNLGVSVSVDYMLEEIAVAEGSLSKKAEFLTKYCCIKQNSSTAWLNSQDVAKCISAPLRLEDFRSSYCVGGIDLSRTTDLTAACIVIQKAEQLYAFCHFWLPSEKIDEATARDGVPYRAFIRRGILSESGDNFVDYADCYEWFRELVEQYQLYPLKIGYDRYNALQLTQAMQQYGFHMDDVYQGENLSPVIDEMEGLIKDGRVTIGDNDLLKIHLLDSALKQNADTMRKRLVKVSAGAHIDGTAALLDALCVRQKWWQEIGEQLRNGE